MFQYQIKKGYENREFTHSRRISDDKLESDEELTSIYLTPVTDTVPAVAPVVAPTPAPQAPANPVDTSQSEITTETVNEEAASNG